MRTANKALLIALYAGFTAAVASAQVQIGAAPEVVSSTTLPRSPLDDRATVRLVDGTFESFLGEVSKQTRLEFILIQQLDQCRISAFIRELPAREILRMTIEVGGLTYQSAGRSNRYLIARRKGGPQCPPVVKEIPGGECLPRDAAPISLKCKNGSLSALAELIHDQSGANLIVWNRAVQHPVTLKVRKAKLEKVMRKVQSDRSLVVRQMGASDRYIIAIAGENSPSNYPAEEPHTNAPKDSDGPKRQEPDANPVYIPARNDRK